jgi:hypothetical protein
MPTCHDPLYDGSSDELVLLDNAGILFKIQGRNTLTRIYYNIITKPAFGFMVRAAPETQCHSFLLAHRQILQFQYSTNYRIQTFLWVQLL